MTERLSHLDIAHANALLENRAVRTGGDHADFLAFGIHDGRALSRRRAVDDEARALAFGRLVGDLVENPLRADKASGLVATTPAKSKRREHRQ